jgi:hypothetical protein
MDPNYAELANNLVEHLKAVGPLLARGIGRAAGGKMFEKATGVLTWLRGKFTRPADLGALEQIEQDPSNPDNWDDLGDRIRRALERDPDFREEFMAIIPSEFRAPYNIQTAITIGNGNVTIQNQGTR